jgi:hypothetical protein
MAIEGKETKVGADKQSPAGQGNVQGGSYLAETGLYGNGVNAEAYRKNDATSPINKRWSASQIVDSAQNVAGPKPVELDPIR